MIKTYDLRKTNVQSTLNRLAPGGEAPELSNSPAEPLSDRHRAQLARAVFSAREALQRRRELGAVRALAPGAGPHEGQVTFLGRVRREVGAGAEKLSSPQAVVELLAVLYFFWGFGLDFLSFSVFLFPGF